jgi:methylphosphotriester-DNA--protein-cysteine methyltransferase
MQVEKRVLPHPALRGIIRSFGERRGFLKSPGVNWPLPPRPHQIIDINLKETFRVSLDGGRPTASPETVVVGPQGSRRIQLHASGDINLFNILFQPAGLNRLTGIDMSCLVNEGIPASDVLGHHAVLLSDAVCLAKDFPSRVAAAERCLGMMLEQCKAADGVDHASRLLMRSSGRTRIDVLIARSGLGARQFQRRFRAQVGLTPKHYARISRFDAALVAHLAAPERRWTDILHDAGYFDQAHFVRECHALTGAPPSRFINDWDNIIVPGRDLAANEAGWHRSRG